MCKTFSFSSMPGWVKPSPTGQELFSKELLAVLPLQVKSKKKKKKNRRLILNSSFQFISKLRPGFSIN